MNWNRIMAVLLAAGIGTAAGAVEIVRGGKAVAVIEIAPDATAADRFAAGELKEFLAKMTGAELPVITEPKADAERIVVGRATGLDGWRGVDEVRMLTPDAHTLQVAGEGARGTLYAVYTLLEELGVRFYAPDCEVLPHGGDLTLERIDYRYRPPFAYREEHSEIANDHPLLSVRWRLNGGMFRGGLTEELGGCFQMDMSHSLINEFLKPDAFFAEHPEWYALDAATGERKKTQLCLSNPDARAELIREVRAKLAAHPELRFVAIGGNDNDGYCQCDECKSAVAKYGTQAAPYLLALNETARAIRDEYPGVLLMFQAYWTTERPPENLALEPNVAVTLAMLNRNHGLPAGETPRHNPYLGRWRDLTGGKVYLWDYWATFGNFLLPMPNLDALESSMRTYCEFGVRGVFCQLPFGSLADFGELRAWLFAQLAWNPWRDAAALTDEFCRACYGGGADAVLAYIALEEKARDRDPGTWIGVYSEETKHWLAPADVRRMRELLDQALAATQSDAAAHDRVRRLRAGLLLVEALRYAELAAAGNPMPPRDKLIDELEALGREFKCGAYKEWDDFCNLIKRLRETPPPPPTIAGKGTVTIAPERLTGVAAGAPELGNPFMDFERGAVKFTVPEELAGIWDVAVTVRLSSSAAADPAAAYVGIYAPNEAARLPVPGGALAAKETTIRLGRRPLPAGSHIWAMAGVTGATGPVGIGRIVLTGVAE